MAGPDKNPVPGLAGLEQKQCNLLRQALSSSDISTGGLWLRHLGIGGSADHYDVDAYLQPRAPARTPAGAARPRRERTHR